jgi:uncharacterized protein (DUF305 family)
MKKLKLLATAGALVATITLAGCGSSSGGHDMGSMSSPSTSAAPSTSSSGTPAAGAHNDADVMFAQMMIPHHRQAIEMADMILAKQGISSEVTALATGIKGAQTPEIDQMTGWLVGWGQSGTPSMDMGHDMGGTMSQADMDALHKAAGKDAEKVFLTGMITHHQGAIDMAEDELANGQNPDAKKLAQSVSDTQQVEIDKMNQLLGT